VTLCRFIILHETNDPFEGGETHISALDLIWVIACLYITTEEKLPRMQTAIVFGVDSEGVVVGTLAGPSSLLGNVSEHRTPVTPGDWAESPCFVVCSHTATSDCPSAAAVFLLHFRIQRFLRLGTFRANSLDVSSVDIMLNSTLRSYLDLENAKQVRVRESPMLYNVQGRDAIATHL